MPQTPGIQVKDKVVKSLFEVIIAKNVSDLGKEISIQVWEAQRAPTKMNPRKTTPIHVVIKMQNLKMKRES